MTTAHASWSGKGSNTLTLEQNARLLLKNESKIVKEQRISEASKPYNKRQSRHLHGLNETNKEKRGISPSRSDIGINSSPVSIANGNNDDSDNENENEFRLQKGKRKYNNNNNNNNNVRSSPSMSVTLTEDMSSIYDSHYSQYSQNIGNIQNGTMVTPMTVTSMMEPRWSTANWTAIFMHFHSLQHRTNVHIAIFLFGIFLIVGLIMCELLFFQGNSLLFTRLSDWTMLGLFLYIIIAIISLSKYSNKKICILRDRMYAIEWINSILCLIVGILMILPYDFDASYIDCVNNDTKCNNYKTESKIKRMIIFIILIISHSFEIVYVFILSITFDHRYSFRNGLFESFVLICSMILYISWNGVSYFITDYWPYQFYSKYIEQNNLQLSIIDATIISVILIIISLLCYILCYFLHRYCSCCCRSRNKDNRYFDSGGYSNFSLQMQDKVDELHDMPSGFNNEVLTL